MFKIPKFISIFLLSLFTLSSTVWASSTGDKPNPAPTPPASGIAADLAVKENGKEGQQHIIFEVILSEINNTGADISFDLTDLETGTATVNNDYTALLADAKITVPVGAQRGLYSLNVIDDNEEEDSETVKFKIENPSSPNVIINVEEAQASIEDNDQDGGNGGGGNTGPGGGGGPNPPPVPPQVGFAVNVAVMVPGKEARQDIIFEAILSAINNTAAPISVDLVDLKNGSATSNEDYNEIPNGATISIPVGAQRGFYTVAVIDDAIIEPAETVNVKIENPSSPDVVINAAQASAFIEDNDKKAPEDDPIVETGNNETRKLSLSCNAEKSVEPPNGGDPYGKPTCYICVNTASTLTTTVSPDNSTLFKYKIKVPDGSELAVDGGKSITHTFTQVGVYEVTVSPQDGTMAGEVSAPVCINVVEGLADKITDITASKNDLCIGESSKLSFSITYKCTNPKDVYWTAQFSGKEPFQPGLSNAGPDHIAPSGTVVNADGSITYTATFTNNFNIWDDPDIVVTAWDGHPNNKVVIKKAFLRLAGVQVVTIAQQKRQAMTKKPAVDVGILTAAMSENPDTKAIEVMIDMYADFYDSRGEGGPVWTIVDGPSSVGTKLGQGWYTSGTIPNPVAGIYTIEAAYCNETLPIKVKVVPGFKMVVSHNGQDILGEVAICEGGVLNVRTVPVGGGTAPAVNWQLNGVPSAGGLRTNVNLAEDKGRYFITSSYPENPPAAAPVIEANNNAVEILFVVPKEIDFDDCVTVKSAPILNTPTTVAKPTVDIVKWDPLTRAVPIGAELKLFMEDNEIQEFKTKEPDIWDTLNPLRWNSANGSPSTNPDVAQVFNNNLIVYTHGDPSDVEKEVIVVNEGAARNLIKIEANGEGQVNLTSDIIHPVVPQTLSAILSILKIQSEIQKFQKVISTGCDLKFFGKEQGSSQLQIGSKEDVFKALGASLEVKDTFKCCPPTYAQVKALDFFGFVRIWDLKCDVPIPKLSVPKLVSVNLRLVSTGDIGVKFNIENDRCKKSNKFCVAPEFKGTLGGGLSITAIGSAV